MSPRDVRTALVAFSLTFAASGCASKARLAADLSAAASPGHLRPVVACWEKYYEASGFQGEYEARVDLELSRSKEITSARVTSLEPVGDFESTLDTGEFRTCIEESFVEIKLPTAADAEGPGFSSFSALSVKNFKIAFLGDQEGLRKRAGGRQAHVLIGPRADRCQGLYVYYPPRDTSALFTEIALGKGKVESVRGKDADQLARELQKTYDLQLELAVRLRADLANRSLPPANRKRLMQELETALNEARATGAAIGCWPVDDQR